jgi:hypothetical protein
MILTLIEILRNIDAPVLNDKPDYWAIAFFPYWSNQHIWIDKHISTVVIKQILVNQREYAGAYIQAPTHQI